MPLGVFTGLRTSGLKRFDLEDAHFNREYVEVKSGKAKAPQRRLVSIQPNLSTWLEPKVDSEGKAFTVRTINHKVSDYSREQGIEWPKNGLRHSYTRCRLAPCQDAAKVTLEMGNFPQFVFRNHRAVVSPDQAKEWWNITENEHPPLYFKPFPSHKLK